MSVVRYLQGQARAIASYAPAAILLIIAILSSAGQRWH